MKALSIKQPWASLIATPRQDNPLLGIKDIENRTWKTHFRGRIYIHASEKEYWMGDVLNSEQLKVIDEIKDTGIIDRRPTSAIIGEVDIIDCVINHSSIWAEKSEIDFGGVCCENRCPEFIEWDFGQGICYSCKLVGQSYFVSSIPKECLFKEKMPKPIYNWVLANPILYDKPILNVKGKLSFWEFNPYELKKS